MPPYTRHFIDSQVTPKMTDEEKKKRRFPEPVLCDVCGNRVKGNNDYCSTCAPLVSIAWWSGTAQALLDEIYQRRGLTDLDGEL